MGSVLPDVLVNCGAPIEDGGPLLLVCFPAVGCAIRSDWVFPLLRHVIVQQTAEWPEPHNLLRPVFWFVAVCIAAAFRFMNVKSSTDWAVPACAQHAHSPLALSRIKLFLSAQAMS